MASAPFVLRFYRALLKKRQNSRGFTLTELLISMLMASIILAVLLSLVVEMLRTDRSEAVLGQTQQDMNNAIDYISRDVQEAVYVYSSQDQLDAIAGQLSDKPAGTPAPVPVLAFWRVDPIAASDISSLNSNGKCTATATKDECQVVTLRQSAYTLVVYFLQKNGANDIWQGDSRITRYQLTQYSDVPNLTKRAGYSDPAPNKFLAPTTANLSANPTQVWQASGATSGSYSVLVDSIDDPADTAKGNVPDCTSLGSQYNRMPDSSATSNSFFTCVRAGDLSSTERANLSVQVNEDEAARNGQDLVVYLRGDARDKKPGQITVYNTNSKLPTLQARVQVRGILDRRF